MAEHAFIIELNDGSELEVGPDQTIMEAIEASGRRVLNSCREGNCGTCETSVLAGEVDHRDEVLDDDEKAANDVMMICVSRAAGDRLVLDLSCRLRDGAYWVVTDRWQKFTDIRLGPETFARFAQSCSEFLVHAVDVEGLCNGIDQPLVEKLAVWSPLPTTYAGGARSLQDLETVERIGQGRIDLTIGSALDLFGGSGVRYSDCVAFNHARQR